MPPPPPDPRKAYGRAPIPGFTPGQGRWNASDGGRFKQYSGACEIHVTIESMETAGQIRDFHISVYHYPHWTAEKPDTSGRSKLGLWAWRWDAGSPSSQCYALHNHLDIRAVGSSGVLTAARELARRMRAICFTNSSHDGIPMPAAGISISLPGAPPLAEPQRADLPPPRRRPAASLPSPAPPGRPG